MDRSSDVMLIGVHEMYDPMHNQGLMWCTRLGLMIQPQ